MGRPRKHNREPTTTISVADSLRQELERHKTRRHLGNLSDVIKGILNDNRNFHAQIKELECELKMLQPSFERLKKERTEMMGGEDVPRLTHLAIKSSKAIPCATANA